MQKFLYLRIISIIIAVYVTSTLIHGLYVQFRDLSDIVWWILPIKVLFFLLPGANSFSILQLFSRYYPDKEIPRPALVFYRTTKVIAILGIIVSLLSIAANLPMLQELDHPTVLYRTIGIGCVFVTLLIIQVTGGSKLLRTIRTNARNQLENSFA